MNLFLKLRSFITKKGIRGKGVPTWLKILFSALFIYLLYSHSKFDLNTLTKAPKNGWLWAFLFCNHVFMCVLSASKWALLQDNSDDYVSWKNLFIVSWVSQTVGMVAFGIVGADGFKVAYLNKIESKDLSRSIKNVFWDRLSSLVGLFVVFIVGLLCHYCGPVGVLGFSILLMSPKKWRKILSLGTVLQASKAVSFLAILMYLNDSFKSTWFELITPISAGLALELVPASFEGLGWGHFTFFHLFGSPIGTAAYNVFFISKVFFKFSGIIFLLHMWSLFFSACSSVDKN